MEIAATVSTTIALPRETVRAYMTDPAHDTEWIGGLRSVRVVTTDTTDGSVAVGTHVERVAHFLGRRIEYVNEVVALDDDELDMRSVRSPFPMRVTYRFAERGPNTTEVTIENRGEMRGLFVLFRPLVARMLRRNVSRDLATLKGKLESAGS